MKIFFIFILIYTDNWSKYGSFILVHKIVWQVLIITLSLYWYLTHYALFWYINCFLHNVSNILVLKLWFILKYLFLKTLILDFESLLWQKTLLKNSYKTYTILYENIDIILTILVGKSFNVKHVGRENINKHPDKCSKTEKLCKFSYKC